MTHVSEAAHKKARISLPTDSMKRVKSVSGGVSFHCGDKVAEHLTGLPLEQVKGIAATMGIDHGKYDHLNVGQQRMNIGNLIRAKVRKSDDDHALFIDTAQGVREAHEKEKAVAAEKEAADKAAKDAKIAAEKKAAQEEKDRKAAEKAAAKQAAEDEKARKAAAKKEEKDRKAAERKEAKEKRDAEKAAAKSAKAE